MKLKQHLTILSCLLFTLNLSSQIVNIDSKRQSDKQGVTGITEITFDYNKSTQRDWEFSNLTYLQWDNNRWSILLLNEINLDRAGGIDFSNDGYQHLRLSNHLNTNYTIESYLQNQFDPIRDIINRKLIGIGLRVKIIESCYIGLSSFYEREELVEKVVKDIRLSSTIQIKINLSNNISLSSTTYFQPILKNLKDNKSSNETTLLISLNERLSFTNNVSLSFDSDPAIGIPNLIFNIKNGFVYSL